MEGEEEAIHDILVKLFDKRFLAEHWNSVVDAAHSFNKVVIVDTAHKVGHEALSNPRLDTGEDELEEIQDTGAVLETILILKDHIGTELFRFHCFSVPED